MPYMFSGHLTEYNLFKLIILGNEMKRIGLNIYRLNWARRTS